MLGWVAYFVFSRRTPNFLGIGEANTFKKRME